MILIKKKKKKKNIKKIVKKNLVNIKKRKGLSKKKIAEYAIAQKIKKIKKKIIH